MLCSQWDFWAAVYRTKQNNFHLVFVSFEVLHSLISWKKWIPSPILNTEYRDNCNYEIRIQFECFEIWTLVLNTSLYSYTILDYNICIPVSAHSTWSIFLLETFDFTSWWLEYFMQVKSSTQIYSIHVLPL